MIALFSEDRFPTLDSCPIPLAGLKRALTPLGPVTPMNLAGLSKLSADSIRLLILPYGSAFPKEGWQEIHRYLGEGGNLLVLGGSPFERAVFREGTTWKVEPAQTAFHQSLGLEQWSPVSASLSARTQDNPEEPWLGDLGLLPLDCHSGMGRFTDVNEDETNGAVGPMDRAMAPILWGVDGTGRRMSCQAFLVDCRQGRFEGGRWVFAPCRFTAWGPREDKMAARLAACALVGALEVDLRPSWACYAPGDQPDLTMWVRGHRRLRRKVRLDWVLHLEETRVDTGSFETELGEASAYETKSLQTMVDPGLYRLETRVSVDGHLVRVQSQGFWGWDDSLVTSAPQLAAEGSRLKIDGRDAPIVGTTYMAGDVSRKFFTHPNPAVWNRDMGRMAADGVNLVRTGFWVMHRQFMLDPGRSREDSLRAMDAFILTTLRHRLPLFITFFSFTPNEWPSDHPYLDPRALSAQREFMLSLVRRYARIPSVGWDYINEPSVSDPKRLWRTRPLPGRRETEAFRAFLRREYAGDLEALRLAWNATPEELPNWDRVFLPEEIDFNEFHVPQKGVSWGGRALDFQKYSQALFARWVADHSRVLREATDQLLSVGQDGGGVSNRRPNNHSFHAPLDLTCNHTWWENEDLVFGAKASVVKGKPFLVQENGIMFTDNLNRNKRVSDAEAAKLFERKSAASFMAGAGFIQWCWNLNVHMNERNEVEIGAWRGDGTARPEAWVLAAFGDFFRRAQGFLQGEPEGPGLGVVNSYTGLWSNRSHTEAALRASHRALGALALPYHTLGEWEFDLLTTEKVILLPSVHRIDPKALAGWMKATAGRLLVVSGPVAQDGYGRPGEGLASFGVVEKRVPVQPVEGLTLAGGGLSVTYSHGKPHFVDKDDSLPAKIHAFKKGRNQLLYQPLPVESGDSRESVVAYYGKLLAAAGVKPMVKIEGADPMEVTVHPRRFGKTSLYVAFNEGSRDSRVRVKDGAFGFTATLDLPAGRAALAVYDAKGKCLAAYRPPSL